tara:strand:+ start:144 stop:308 length:165 start_codon:yes stop_codon:yes gene_type:complete
MTDKIKYVEHPVTAEEKAKLRKEGYKILDARFDPNRDEKKADKKADSKKDKKAD